MTDDIDLIPSPCIGECRMDPASNLCQGCLRTIDEIVQWGQADETFKRTVWLAIGRRASAKKSAP